MAPTGQTSRHTSWRSWKKNSTRINTSTGRGEMKSHKILNFKRHRFVLTFTLSLLPPSLRRVESFSFLGFMFFRLFGGSLDGKHPIIPFVGFHKFDFKFRTSRSGRAKNFEAGLFATLCTRYPGCNLVWRGFLLHFPTTTSKITVEPVEVAHRLSKGPSHRPRAPHFLTTRRRLASSHQFW